MSAVVTMVVDERIVIDFTKEGCPTPVVVLGSIHRTLVSVGVPAPALGLFCIKILQFLILFLFAYLVPVRRHLQAVVEVQRGEPYQNADVIVNQLVADGLALPIYNPPPYEE